MKKAIIPTLAVLATFGVLVGLAAFTDINSPQYYGKTGIPKAYSAIDANFAAIESGTQAGAFTTLTINDATIGGMFRITPTALTVTNAQPITITDSSYILNVSGSANNYTNTPVIANPTTAGDIVILHVLAASSNLIAIANSGNMLLSAAWEGGDNDVLVLHAITTSLWAEISRSDN